MGEKESSDKIEYVVEFDEVFNLYYTQRFSKSTVAKIDDFIDHYVTYGLNNWKGKIRSSANVPYNYPDRIALINKAVKHNLWHVHIGEPIWKKSQNGDYYVSDWVLQFKKLSNYHIILVELSWHNPMLLPSDEILEKK